MYIYTAKLQNLLQKNKLKIFVKIYNRIFKCIKSQTFFGVQVLTFPFKLLGLKTISI